MKEQKRISKWFRICVQLTGQSGMFFVPDNCVVELERKCLAQPFFRDELRRKPVDLSTSHSFNQAQPPSVKRPALFRRRTDHGQPRRAILHQILVRPGQDEPSSQKSNIYSSSGHSGRFGHEFLGIHNDHYWLRLTDMCRIRLPSYW